MKIYYFADVIKELNEFWSERGCAAILPTSTEVGAGTLSAMTALRAIQEDQWRICYTQPSIRPQDGRFGKNKNRLYQHHQFQLLWKPAPDNIKNLYMESLKNLGIDLTNNEVKFLEDDWQNPSIGAKGVGWEVWLNGIEVSQFTYIHQIGGVQLSKTAIEITYGLERLILFIQGKNDVFELDWNANLKYKDLFLQNEQDFSGFVHENLDAEIFLQHFDNYERICHQLLEKKLPFAAYDYCLKCSHTLNLLDAAQKLGHQERANYIFRTRKMAKQCCELIAK